ncbi:PP2C family protein-serine/threonine phosphatase [Parablastomonas sp. CN1-191]|uniref:PP2C family protein-serine/threonine phosphatase n=1 Tax=Parablastomonas sp. CN1-191 TaxID=3400908 RepID=UPI003BF913AD
MATSSPSSAAIDRLNVLVVDDDVLLAQYLALQLGRHGCRTETTDSGERALELLAKGQFDQLITDWQMPGMDGMELARRARAQHGRERHIHITMITADEDGDAIGAALAAGVDDFLRKPIDALQLQLAVESTRRNRRLHRRLARRTALVGAAHRRARSALDAVQADIDAAAALHRRLLPADGAAGALDIASIYHPASVLGGDSIGVMPLEDAHVLFFLIDVRGHGVPAALDSFHLHHRLKQFRSSSPEALADAIAALNREIAERGDDSYATMIVGIADPSASEAWIVRAGHPPALTCDAGGARRVGEEANGGFPLGWFADATFRPEMVRLGPGTRLLLLSDGVEDTLDGDGGDGDVSPALSRILETGRNDSLTHLVGTIDRALDAKRPATGFADDVSVLVLECCHEDRR